MPHAYLRSPVASGPAFFCSKVTHASRQEARKAIDRLHNGASHQVAHGNVQVHAYECKTCGGWHIGGRARRAN